MNQLSNLFFGPIGMKYCNIFFIYTIFTLFTLFFVFWIIITSILKKRFNWSLVAILILNILIYLQQRVLYNMCLNKIEGMSVNKKTVIKQNSPVYSQHNFHKLQRFKKKYK